MVRRMPDEPQLEPVEPGYRNVLRARMAVFTLVSIAACFVFDRLLLAPEGYGGILTVAAIICALTVLVVAPHRIYRRLRYGVGEHLLQVVRGWLFHTDTIVPLARVQHLDVVRGPLDKMFGTSSLVVHTAGTHNSVVIVPGLAPARAAEMRDIIREHFHTDAG
jgi:membrane protein YdbS with pleckstrin-like domain